MNITPFTIYLISRLTPLHDFLTVLTVLSAITSVLAVILLLVVSAEDGSEGDLPVAIRRFIRWPISVLILSSLATAVVPTTKDVAAMIVIPRIANSQTVQELGENVVGLAKAWYEELKPGNKDGGKK